MAAEAGYPPSADCRLLDTLVQAAAACCEDPRARRLIDARILPFMIAMIEDGLVGEALLDLDTENEIHMDRIFRTKTPQSRAEAINQAARSYGDLPPAAQEPILRARNLLSTT
jgi:hypothetical protein